MSGAPAWQNSAAFTFGGSSFTAAYDPTAAVGDYVRILVNFYTSQTFAPNSAGWNLLYSSTSTNTYVLDYTLTAPDIVAGGTTFTIDNGFVDSYCIEGHRDSTAVQDGPAIVEGNGAPFVLGPLTLTGGADTMSGYVGVDENSGNITTDPPGMTLVIKQQNAFNAGDTAIYYVVGSGTLGPYTGDTANSGNTNNAVAFSNKPAGGGGGGAANPPFTQHRTKDESNAEDRMSRQRLLVQLPAAVTILRTRRAAQDDAAEDRALRRRLIPGVAAAVNNPPTRRARPRSEESTAEDRTAHRVLVPPRIDQPPTFEHERQRDDDPGEERSARRQILPQTGAVLIADQPQRQRRTQQEDTQDERSARRTRYTESVDAPVPTRRRSDEESAPEEQTARRARYVESVDNLIGFRKFRTQEDNAEDRTARRALVPPVVIVPDNPPTRRARALQEDTPEDRAARRALVPPQADNPPTRRARALQEDTPEDRAARRASVPPQADNPPTRRARALQEDTPEDRARPRTAAAQIQPPINTPPTRRTRSTQEDATEDRSARRPLLQTLITAAQVFVRRTRQDEQQIEERSRRSWILVDSVDQIAPRRARALQEDQQEVRTPRRRTLPQGGLPYTPRRWARVDESIAEEYRRRLPFFYVPATGSVRGCAAIFDSEIAAAFAQDFAATGATLQDFAITGAGTSEQCCN